MDKTIKDMIEDMPIYYIPILWNFMQNINVILINK